MTRVDGHLRIAFLIGEVVENAGQTRNLLEVIRNLHDVDAARTLSIFTYRKRGSIKLPDYVDLHVLSRYYSALLTYRSLSAKLAEYDVAYVKGNFPYLISASQGGVPTILVVHQMDSPRIGVAIKTRLAILAANVLVPFMLRRASAVVTVTDELATFYLDRYGVKVTVIEDQISDAFYSNIPRTIPKPDSEHIELLSVGYWDGVRGRKRQQNLFPLLKAAAKVMPGVHLSLVGLEERSIPVLRQFADSNGIGDRVSLVGLLSQTELIQRYLQANVYVTATTYEGFYRQIVEGFANGLPALAFDSRELVGTNSRSASANHILKSHAGKLFSDAATFVEELQEIMQNYPNYAEKARGYARNYQARLISPKTEKLLSDVIYRHKTQSQ